VSAKKRKLGDGLGDQQVALQQLIGPLKAQITLAKGTVCNLGNDITEIVTRGMVLRVKADEYDTEDPAKAGRNAYGRCRVQHVPTDGAGGEYQIEINGDEHMKFLTLCQMIRQPTNAAHRLCYGSLEAPSLVVVFETDGICVIRRRS
jgi:hypothetical protein